MKWFGAAVRLEQFDDGDRLRFRVTSERKLAALIIPMFAGLALLVYAWRYETSWLVLLGAAALLGFPLWRWFEVRVTELRVTELELVADGDFGATADVRWLQWADVTSLQFRHVEDDDHGLYATTRDGSMVCLLADVDAGQVGQMIHAIYGRFPYVAMAEASEVDGESR